MRLTDENLHLCVLPEGKAERFYHDDDLSGLGIRVRRDMKGRTRRNWFFYYRSKTNGAQHRINLGSVDRPAAVSTTKARQAATELSIRVQTGGNRQRECKAAKADRKRLLLDEAMRYLEDRRTGVIGKRPPTLHAPYAVAFAAAWLAQQAWRVFRLRGAPLLLTNDVKSFGSQWHISNDKLVRELGWSPRVSIADGMDAALAYLKQFRTTR